MSLTNSPWMYSSSGGFYNEVATQSLRFDDGSTAYLTRTPSSAGNRKTWTMSFWIKFSSIKAQTLFATRTDTAPYGEIRFESDGGFFFYGYTGSAYQYRFDTTQLFRDTSAWYHFVFAMDTTQSTESNRTKIYVNGSQITAFDNETYPTQNVDTNLNTTVEHDIGYDVNSSVQAFDGYMAEYNFIDGSALDPTSFGETKNGVWIPKEYTGSYGTNGFRLQFNQTGTGTASSSTIGADTSGNDNHFSSSGIVASDCAMLDSPENNFATICPLSSEVSGTFSEGNLKYYSNNDSGNANQGISSGNFYAEVYVSGGSNSYVGVIDISKGLNPNRGGDFSGHGAIAYKANGDQYSLPIGGSSSTASYGATYTSGDIIGIAVDVDADTITFYKNGVSQGNTTNGVSHISSDGIYSILVYGTGVTYTVNFGQDSTFAGATTAGGNADENDIGDFKYSVPSGFLALCTANLPQPTINIPTGFFNTVTYTGNSINSASTNAVTNVGHEPDFLWIKQIDTTRKHVVWNVAETPVYVSSDSNNIGSSVITDGVWNSTNGATYTANGGGFTVAEGDIVNANGGTFVAWSWHTVGNSGFSNNNGDINVIPQSKNVTAGISLGDYFGNGTSGETIAHGLNAAPEVIITKQRSGGGNSWSVFHKDVGTSGYLNLDNSNAIISSSENVQAVDATYYTVGNDGTVNQASSYFFNFVFHSVDGYSKFSSYTGNGSTDGTFVNTGFRPAWLMIKNTGVGSWVIQDTKRSPINPSKERIWADLEDGESSSTYDIDFLSNGFKHRNTHSDTNSSSTYIYMAFAEKPFKYANAR